MEAIRQYCSKHLAEDTVRMPVKLEMGCFCEKVSKNVPLSEIVVAYVNQIVRQKQVEAEKTLAYRKSMDELRQKIYRQPQKKWNIEEMAQMLLRSRAYFQRLYKKISGSA
ncbi:MAG: helix-turn-helix transcriptional regulator [Ruminococcus sp.]